MFKSIFGLRANRQNAMEANCEPRVKNRRCRLDTSRIIYSIERLEEKVMLSAAHSIVYLPPEPWDRDFRKDSYRRRMFATGSPGPVATTLPDKFPQIALVTDILSARILDANTIEYTYRYSNYRVEGVTDSTRKTLVSLDKIELVQINENGTMVDSSTKTARTGLPAAVTTDAVALQYIKAVIWKNTPAWWYNVKDPVLMATQYKNIGPQPVNYKWTPN